MPKQPKAAVNPIVARIDQEIARKGGSRQSVSLAAGLDRGALQKLNDRGPLASTLTVNLYRLARAAGIPVEELLAIAPAEQTAEEDRRATLDAPSTGPQRELPILGAAAGSALGSFTVASDPVGYVAMPPALDRVPGAYAVYVYNDSMSPLHSQGDLRFVNPFKPPRKGESVIVQIRDSSGEIEAYIKIYENSTPEWLVCRQLNPPAEVKYSRKQVVAVHKVLSVNELFHG